MNQPEKAEYGLNRRTLIKGFAAFGVASLACRAEEKTPESEPIANTASSSTSGNGSQRLYKVEPKAKLGYAGLNAYEMKPAPVRYNWGERYGKIAEAAVAPQLHYFMWATPAEAEAIGNHEAVKKVSAASASSVVELGEPSAGKGKLAIKLFAAPGASAKKPKVGLAEEVAAAWRQQFKDVSGVSVSLPKKSKEPFSHGKLPEADQVIIEFTTDLLDPKVLKMIKSHPRTIAIKWGELFTFFSCPGCGLG